MRNDPRTIVDIEQDPGLHRKPVTNKVEIKKISINIPKYHWKRDKLDTRDYKYVPTLVKESNYVDLRPYCSKIEDQGNLGSCTGQAIAGAIELLNNRNKKPTDISRLFIYYFERVLLGTAHYDSGAYIRDGIKVTYKQGAPLERLWPYVVNKFRAKPTPIAQQDATKRKVTLYERVQDFDGCISALSNGFPIVIGFDVYSSFESPIVYKTGMMPYPKTEKEILLGGHAVLLVGYDKLRQVFIARNSWGPYWGDKGYFYMPFRVIQNTSMSGDFWIIKTVNNP